MVAPVRWEPGHTWHGRPVEMLAAGWRCRICGGLLARTTRANAVWACPVCDTSPGAKVEDGPYGHGEA